MDNHAWVMDSHSVVDSHARQHPSLVRRTEKTCKMHACMQPNNS